MYLTNIEQIKEDGTTVFMPSGIQATIFNEGENILVKYYNLREDKYSVEDFKKLMNEGIFIFNDRPTTQVIENKKEDKNMDKHSILEKLVKKGFMKPVNEVDENGENTLESFFNLDQTNFKTKEDLIKHIQDNTDYDVVASDNLSLTVKDRTDNQAEEIVVNLPHAMKEAYDQSKNKVGDVHKGVQYKKEHPEYLTPEFKLELMANLDRIAREYPNVHIRQQATEYLDEVALQEYWDTKRIIDFVKKYIDLISVKVLENVDPMRIDFENKVVTSLKENLEENLGEDYLNYLGKVRLICENKNNDYEIICAISEDADDILTVPKSDFDEDIVRETISMLNYKIRRDELDEVFAKHDINEVTDDLVASAQQGYVARMEQSSYGEPEKEAMKKFNRQVIARNERKYGKDYFNNFKIGDVVKNIKDEKGRIERIDGEGKFAILALTPLEGIKRNIDGYAWEFVPVAQNESMNEMIIDCILDRKDGDPYSPEQFYRDVFEYGDVGFDITRAMDGGTEQDVKDALKQYIDKQGYAPEIKDYIDSVEWLNESFKEELGKTYINIKGQDVNIESDSYGWIDDDTFVLHLPESGYLTDEAGDKFTIECEYHADENDYSFTAVFEDDRISLDRENTFISEDDKELIKEHIDKLIAELDPMHESVEIKEDNKAPYEVIAQDLIDGHKDGFEPTEYGNWLCKTSLDFVWEKLTPNMKLFILQMIGHSVDTNILSDNNFRVKFNYPICDEYDLDDNDLESLGLFEREEILNMINDNYKTIDFLMDYEIQFDNKVGDKNESKQVKKSSKKSLKESKLKEEYGEYQGQLDEVADDIERYNNSNEGAFETIDGISYEWGPLTINGNTWDELGLENSKAMQWIRYEIAMPIKDGHDYYNGLDCILVLGESELKDYNLDEECPAKDSFIADMVKLGCDEETLKDAIEYIKKNGDKDRSDCKEVEWWINYDINLVEMEDEEDDEYIKYVDEWQLLYKDNSGLEDEYFEEDEDAAQKLFDETKEHIKQFIHKTYKIINNDTDHPEEEDVEVIYQDLDEQFKLKDKKKKKKKLDELNKGKEMKKLSEDCYKVYNNIDNQDCGVFNSWNDAMNFLNKEWGDYSANMVKENPHFGTDEDKMNYFGQFDLVPTKLPVAVDVVEPAETEVCPDCGNAECTCVVDNGIEDIIAGLLDEPVCTDCEDGVCEEPAICPDCGNNPCTCGVCPECGEEDELEKLDDENLTDEDEEEENKIQEMCMQKLPDPKDLPKNQDEENKVKNKKTKKQEAFKDEMSMLTDINDTDFPDALQQAVDTKEDGSLYKISDIAKEIEELKASFKQEIENIKQDIKTTLTDIKQDIKLDVKDIQTDVTSKLDNTNSKIADLTSEEGLDDEELDLENENPADTEEELNLENENPEGTDEEETTEEPEMTEAELAAYKKVLMNNPLYEQIKEVIRGSSLAGKKMSIETIREKLREDYGVRTNIEMYSENIYGICEYTPIKKYIIDRKLEESLLKEQNLGIAKCYLKEGLNAVWEREAQAKLNNNLKSIINNEDLNQAKKAVDTVADRTNGNPDAIKKAIELTAENDQEKQQALDYAVDKIEENVDMDNLSLKLSRATSSGILGGLGMVEGEVKNAPRRK